MPAGFTKLVGEKHNWCFHTVPQKHVNQRRMYYPQGRTLGGSTSINAMIYIRGHREDYDHWRELGNDGWGYEDVLPYFKKMENNERFVDKYHSQGGPLNVTDQLITNPLTKAFVRSLQEQGIPYNPDVKGAEQDGVTFYQVTQRNARRESAATAYVKPIMKRANFKVITKAVASKVLIENGRAVAVEYIRNGNMKETARAGTEVIVSGGAVCSPKLLLLSGIGPADELKEHSIDVLHDLPGVGKNLQDHMDVYILSLIHI